MGRFFHVGRQRSFYVAFSIYSLLDKCRSEDQGTTQSLPDPSTGVKIFIIGDPAAIQVEGSVISQENLDALTALFLDNERTQNVANDLMISSKRNTSSLNNLTENQIRDILGYLEVARKPPGLENLNQLINAYTRKVPWESVSRILKRCRTDDILNCPRWPAEFWGDAVKHGMGGTCFESNLAFFSLIEALGYQGYLTLNDMGESPGVHSAMVVFLRGRKYLVDVTILVGGAVRIDPNNVTWRKTTLHDFRLIPDGKNRYQVERSHHKHPNAFTFIDKPITPHEYRSVVENDYGPDGFFLSKIVINKVIGSNYWRFLSDLYPYRLESFSKSGKLEEWLPSNGIGRVLGEKFQIPSDKIAAAIQCIPDLN